MRFALDASVAVEVLLRTELGESVTGILERSDLLAPELLDSEVLAVLRRAVLSDRLDEARARQALDDLILWPIDRVPHGPLLKMAWTFRHNVTGYDALYLAAAAIHGATLLTADAHLAAIPSPGIAIHLVRI